MTLVLARANEAGYRHYRIPALGVTATGRLIAVYDARPDVDDLPAPIDLVCRHSDDGGRTWSPQRVLRTGTGLDGFGDASIFGDDGTGRVLVVHTATTTRGFFEDTPGADPNDATHAHIDLAISDDDGLTWRFRRITGQLKSPDADAAFAASGTGALVRSGQFAGRLLQPVVDRVGKQIRARLAFSDDHGESWQLGQPVAGGNESSATGLADGRVLFSSRATPRRLTGWSTDGGASLDAQPDAALVDPSDNGSVLALSNGDVICSHNHDEHLRANLVIHRSHDGGLTWPDALVVEPDSAAYSTTVELPDGQIAILYERAGYTQIVFDVVDPAGFAPVGEVLVAPAGLEVRLVWRLVRPVAPPAGHGGIVMEIARDGWDPAAWRETGAAAAGEHVQVLHTRDDYAKLGPISPGLKVGDDLLFNARIVSHDGPASALTWQFGDQASGVELDLAQGEVLRLDLHHKLTDVDVAAGRIDVELCVNATVGNTRQQKLAAVQVLVVNCGV